MKEHKYKFDYSNNRNYMFLFCGIILAGMGMFLTYSYVIKRYLLVDYPYGDFLFYRNDIFMDFFNVNHMSEKLNPYLGGKSSYPPFVLFVSYLLTLLVPQNISPLEMSMTTEGRILYVTFFGVITVIFMITIWSFLKKYSSETNPFILGGVTICCVYNAAFIWCLDRGNYLILAIVAYFMFFYFYNKNDNIAVLFLGIAIAIKIYPIFAIILFLLDKKFKKFFQCVFVTGILSLFPLLFFKGGIIANIIAFIQGVLGFGGGYEQDYMNIYFCTGLNSVLKLIQKMMFGKNNVEGIFFLMYILLAVFVLASSVILLKKEKRFYMRCMILTLLVVFIPPLSYEYNLAYMVVPAVLLLQDKQKDKSACKYCILIALLLIPKSYIYLYGWPDCISISVVLNPLILLLILFFFVFENKENFYVVLKRRPAMKSQV